MLLIINKKIIIKFSKFNLTKLINNKIEKVITFGKDKNSNIRILKLIPIDKVFYEIYIKYKNKSIKFIINKRWSTC